jgi:hypothetical protein
MQKKMNNSKNKAKNPVEEKQILKYYIYGSIYAIIKGRYRSCGTAVSVILFTLVISFSSVASISIVNYGFYYHDLYAVTSTGTTDNTDAVTGSIKVALGLFFMVSFLSGNSLYDIISPQAMLVNAVNSGNNAQEASQLTLSENSLSIGPKQEDLTADDSTYDPGTGPEEALTLSEYSLSIGPKQEDLPEI